jgi:uncharacterized protein
VPRHQARGNLCAMAAMAKAPRSGEVKTRLVPPLYLDEAARLSVCFLKDITANFMAASSCVPVAAFIAYSPPGSEDVFRAIVAPEIELLGSRRIGLAYSLLDATKDLLAMGYGSACLVNSDSPTLPTAFLAEAAEALRAPGDRVVIGPASDGGYYLIGLKEAHQRLFEDITWSTERVFPQTLERAASIGLEVVTLPRWYDVDDAASLGWLLREILTGERPPDCTRQGFAAPNTSAYLQALAPSLGKRLGPIEPIGQ